MAVARLPLIESHPSWRVAQLVGVLATVTLLVAFLVAPTPSLHLLWDMVIPLLPAVFLVNPMLWRNVCPLASLNDLAGHRRESPTLALSVLVPAWAVGIVLLMVLVPARHFLFNTHGLPMFVTVTAVALLALAGGFVVSRRGGFCNSICPVLPVEKLYGQAPLLHVGSARCSDCNKCATVGCPDLAGRKSAVQSVVAGGRRSWVWTPFGLFAAAFPGFIIGYFTTADGAVAHAASVYGHVALWSAASLSVAIGLMVVSRARSAVGLLLLGAASLLAYYWFAAPRLVAAFGGGPRVGEIVRAMALLGIGAWAVRGWRRVRA
ncbi:MAG: hypothetical protein K8S21_01780 [Gemmatimonadetes bacterium]|nr:hypothetical protein [Gemmatimonadota bacterium]